MWQLTMYCHWRSPDAMPLITLNVLGPQETTDLMSMASFTFTMRRHLIRLASEPFTSFPVAKFGWVPFADLCVQRMATKQKAHLGRMRQNSGVILSHLWAKVYEISGQCRRPCVISNTIARLSMSRFVQKIFAIKSRSRRKTEQM